MIPLRITMDLIVIVYLTVLRGMFGILPSCDLGLGITRV